MKTIERLRKKGKCWLVVDATGVGMPVVDMLQAAGPDCELTPVLITSGSGQNKSDGVWRVPKIDLLAGLQAALETVLCISETQSVRRSTTSVRLDNKLSQM